MKKIKYAVLPLLLACIIAVGSAFASWHFKSEGKSDNALNYGRDDIFENYNITQVTDTETNAIKEYTMYLYPSTLYLNDYIDCLEGVDGAVLPEDKYGYIEAEIGADGEPVLNESGRVKYSVSNAGGDTEYLTDVSKNITHTMKSNTSDNLGVYYSVYKDSEKWNTTTENNGLPETDITIDSVSVPANSKFLYGDPDLDETVVSYTKAITGMDYMDDSETGGERHNWRNLHYYDRFGYWSYLAKDEGRYLPIKIKVDKDFTNTLYNNIVMSPLADMGDPADWYVYSFSCWAYVDHTKANADAGTDYTAPYYARADFAVANSGTLYVNRDTGSTDGKVLKNPSLGSFCPTTVTQYFDIIESFNRYADADGVIRLFPKFSNGKGYSSTSIQNGSGDGIKAVPAYADADGNEIASSPNVQHELFMFYSNESTEVTQSGSTASVHVSVLPNVDLENYYKLELKVSLSNGNANWGSGWSLVYSFDRQERSDGNKSIPQTIESYGHGLYNLYLFITDVTGAGSGTDFSPALETLRDNLANTKKSDNSSILPSLQGKNLLPVASAYVGKKSFMLVGEKVREAKFIGDINFGDGNSTLENEINSKYQTTHKSFRLINKQLDGYKANSDTSTPIQDEFSYCYILQNVDFTEATTSYCQIRFQRNYRADLHFGDTSEYAYERVEFDNVTYQQAFTHYFDLENVNVNRKNDDGTTSLYGEQQVIKLKNEEMRGIYDFIMVFRKPKTAKAGEDSVVYLIGLFAYRHTNIFLKVYDGNPTGTVTYYQSNKGAILSTATAPEGVIVDTTRQYAFVDHLSSAVNQSLLYNQSYAIGVSIKASDLDASNVKLAARVNGAVGKKSGIDPLNVKLYDHATGAEVAHYNEAGGTPDNTDNYYLHYGGRYYELVFNPFKIRKNYIFYIAYE